MSYRDSLIANLLIISTLQPQVVLFYSCRCLVNENQNMCWVLMFARTCKVAHYTLTAGLSKMKTLRHFPRNSGPGESPRLRESWCEPEPGPGRISEKSASGSAAPLPTLARTPLCPLSAWRLTLSLDKHCHIHVLITTLKMTALARH